MLLYSEPGKAGYRGKSFWPTVFLMGLTDGLAPIRPETEDFSYHKEDVATPKNRRFKS
jgi:hypothetical protein